MKIKVAVNFVEMFSNYTFNIPYIKGNCLNQKTRYTVHDKEQEAANSGGGGVNFAVL